MAKYQKKPVVIEAFQWFGNNKQSEDPEFINEALKNFEVWISNNEVDNTIVLNIKTLEGVMTAQQGDWIIQGVNGELYPCKPDIFEKTYIPAANDFKERLLQEVEIEVEKLNKLNAFMSTVTFSDLPREDKDLLYEQSRVMNQFVQILGKRLDRCGISFTPVKELGFKN